MTSKGFHPLIGIAYVVNVLFLLIGAGLCIEVLVHDYPSAVRWAGLFWATAFITAASATVYGLSSPVRWQRGIAYSLNGLLLLCSVAPRLTAFSFWPNEQMLIFPTAVVNLIALANASGWLEPRR